MRRHLSLVCMLSVNNGLLGDKKNLHIMKAPRPWFDVWSLCVDLSDYTGSSVCMHMLSMIRLKERKYIVKKQLEILLQ